MHRSRSLTRTSNRVEFVQGHYRDHLAALPSRNRAAEVTVNFSLELSSNAHYLVTRGAFPQNFITYIA